MKRSQKIKIGIIGFVGLMLLLNFASGIVPEKFGALTNDSFTDDYLFLSQEASSDNNYRNLFEIKSTNSLPNNILTQLILYPNDDYIEQWKKYLPLLEHYECITLPSLTYPFIYSDVDNLVMEFRYTTETITDTIIAVRVFLDVESSTSNQQIKIRIYDGNQYSIQQTIDLSDSVRETIEVDFLGLYMDQTDVNGFNVRITSVNDDMIKVYGLDSELLYNDDDSDYQKGIETISTQDITYGFIQSKSYFSDEDSWKTTDGLYNASYSFTNDIVGNEPIGFTSSNTGTATSNIIEIKGSHSNVLELFDGSGQAKISKDFLENSSTNGTIEFWWYFDDATHDVRFYLMEGASNVLTLRSVNDDIEYHNGAWNSLGVSLIDDTWYHFRIDIELGNGLYENLAADKANIYINGILEASSISTFSVDYIDEILLLTVSASSYTYYDSFGFSWFDNYTIGNNLYDQITSENNGKYQEKTMCRYFESDILIGTIEIKVVMVKNDVENVFINHYDELDDYSNLFLFSNLFTEINITTLDILFHYYCGYNNVSQNAINYRIEIIPNDNVSLQWDFEGSIISNVNEINVNYVSRCPISHTELGVYHNNLYGLRQLQDDGVYGSFVDFPLFNDYIDVEIPEIPDDIDVDNYSTYWLYTTYNINMDDVEIWYFNTTIEGNDDFTGQQIEYNYTLIKVLGTEAHYPYYVCPTNFLGDWGWAFNWLRDGLTVIINVIIIAVQFVIYFAFISINFLIMYLVVGIIFCFIWNYVIKYIVFAFLYIVLWFLPILEWILSWLLYTFIPILMDILVFMFTIIIAGVLWLVSFGQADLESLLLYVGQFLTIIANFIVDLFTTFIKYIPYFLVYLYIFVILIGLGYIKLLYCKSKGYTSRVKSLEQSINAYTYVFSKVGRTARKTKQTIPVLG